jgi:hypothetical protein
MTIRPGKQYAVYVHPDANITMPTGRLYVTVMDGPFPDGTVQVYFNMAVMVRTSDLQDI